MTIYILGMLIILLPLLLITWLSFGKVKSKPEWLLRFILVGSVVFICYRIGTWSMTSYYIKFVIVAIFAGSTLYSFQQIRAGLWHIPKDQWFRFSSTALFSLTGILLASLTFFGASYSGNNTTSLKFPFGQGHYYVIQGGSNIMTNPFHRMATNGKYAIDIVAINNLGNRATHFFPQKLDQYHIFGKVIYSPCEGRVLTTVSRLADNMPVKVNREYPAGNHMIIECGNINVMLAHLKKDSLTVSQGDNVLVNQPVGEVGNSGYSDEPHLHIQANKHDGNPVSITFDGKFLSINDLYIIN